MSDPSKRVVIIGGGTSGLMLATRLGRRYRRSTSVEIVLIDRAAVHVWKPMLHSFAAGTAHPNHDGVPFIAQAKRAGFVYLPGEFIGIDSASKQVEIKLAATPENPPLRRKVDFDYAVLAFGSGANDFGTPGVRENCFFIDTLWNAETLNATVRQELIRAIATEQELKIAIVGAGATGVEFAADLASLVHIGESYGAQALPEQLRITLLTSSLRILPAFPENVAERVEESLRELNVDIVGNARVSSVTPSSLHLVDGGEIDATIKVWTAGTASIVEKSVFSDFEVSRSNRLTVNKHLETTRNAEVFAMGDCASFVPPHSASPLPPTGQVARQQADFLFKTISRKIENKPLPTFEFKEMGSLVSLSQFGAHGQLSKVGIVPAIALKGWVAKGLHRLFYRMHQFGLYGPMSGLVVMLRDGLDSFVRPSIRMD